jgi:hypothetical protein
MFLKPGSNVGVWIGLCLLCILACLPACQRSPQQTEETIVKADTIAINPDAVNQRDSADNQNYDPDRPVGLPTEDLPERKLGKYITVIPEGAITDPGGNLLDPAVMDIIGKLERGEELDRDEEITFLVIDYKFRNFEEIRASGESQAD